MRTPGLAIRAAAGVLAAVALAGCVAAGSRPAADASSTPQTSAAQPRTAQPSPTHPSTPLRPSTLRPSTPRLPTTSAPPAPSGSSVARALRSLATIPVKGRAPLTGYDRDEFGTAWTDDNNDVDGHNGCDTRNDVLRRDLTDITLKPDTHGCLVLTGVLHDPYTATTIQFVRGVGTSNAVQVDHVVALGNAWQTGAQYWSDAKRVDFANDPLELLAVDGSANESKGDGDTATWLPPNKSYRCAYVERQVAVKARYGLWTTPSEHDAMSRVLNRYCQ